MKHNIAKEDCIQKELDSGFNDWMSSCLEYEYRKRNNKKISKKLKNRMEKSFNWLNNLSDEAYQALIH